MTKKEMELKLKEYQEILADIRKCINPKHYELDAWSPKERLVFHLKGVNKILEERL